MTWARWKKDFRNEIAKHLNFYRLEYLMLKDTPYIELGNFIKDIPKIWDGNTNRPVPVGQTLYRLGYKSYGTHEIQGGDWITIESGGATFDIVDNPFVLAEVYKRTNQRF